MTVIKIRKRNGTVVDFDKEKVTSAIFKAAQSVGGDDKVEASRVVDRVYEMINETYDENNLPTVETVQDSVEKALIETGHAATAKSYILNLLSYHWATSTTTSSLCHNPCFVQNAIAVNFISF